jgi:hypothetical protein
MNWLLPHRFDPRAAGLVLALIMIAFLCEAQTGVKSPAEQQFLEKTKTAIADNDWDAHTEFLENTIFDSIKAVPASSDPRRYDKILSDPLLSKMLAQDEFIHSVTSLRLETLIEEQDCADFVGWLLTNTDAMEAYVTAVKPADDPDKVFEVWHNLWKNDPEGREEYKNLALACALVFDGPLQTKPPRIMLGFSRPEVDVSDRYAFFHNSDKVKSLKTQLSELPVRELVWVVDAPVSNEELTWAQSHVNYPRAKWGEAYASIKYQMDMVVKGKELYEDYSLKEILKKGGVCLDQGYFAAMTAKANGIPAMLIVGEGQRSGHAWFGYKESSKKWNMTAGRYTSDDYATGTTTDPQTGETIKEQELYLLADEQTRSPDYLKTWRLLWLSRIAGDKQRLEDQGALLESAIAASSRHVQAWDAYIAYLSAAKTSADKWKQVIKTMKTAFHNYPDMLARANQVERDKLIASQGSGEVVKNLSKETKKLAHGKDGRTDLVLEKISEQVTVLINSGKTNDVCVVYKKSLDQFGKEVVAFETLASDYFSFARKAGVTKDALRAIEAAFKRHYSAGGGDYFTMETRARLIKMIADFYEQDGQTRQAERYRKEADRIMQTANSGQGKLK